MVGEQPLVSAEVIIFTLHQNLTNTCYVCEHYFFSLLKSKIMVMQSFGG